MKLDVEGSEVAALEGGRSTIERFRPVLLVEVEAERLASQGRDKDELLQLLDELGYEPYVFDAEIAQLRAPNLPAEPEGNVVALPAGLDPPRLRSA